MAEEKDKERERQERERAQEELRKQRNGGLLPVTHEQLERMKKKA